MSDSRWQRFVDRVLPAEERADALWIAATVAVLGVVRALVYTPALSIVSSLVASPGTQELGFALRATAITDVAWGVVAALVVWLLFRFTRAPRAVALYLILAGVGLATVSLGSRLSLDAVSVIARSTYKRVLLSDMQPIMLALAEAVGVVLGAWAARAGLGETRSDDGGTLLPALGLEARPFALATRLAIGFAIVQITARLAVMLFNFLPAALSEVAIARQVELSSGVGVVQFIVQVCVSFAVPALVVYLAVTRRFAAVSVWVVFFATGAGPIVGQLRALPSQLVRSAGGQGTSEFVAVSLFNLASAVLTALLPLLGVWLATRPEPMSAASATLPAEDNDHW